MNKTRRAIILKDTLYKQDCGFVLNVCTRIHNKPESD